MPYKASLENIRLRQVFVIVQHTSLHATENFLLHWALISSGKKRGGELINNNYFWLTSSWSYKVQIVCHGLWYKRRHDTQYKDIQHNDTQYNNTQHSVIKRSNTQNTNKKYDTQNICDAASSIVMLGVIVFTAMIHTVMLSVIIQSVVALLLTPVCEQQ